MKNIIGVNSEHIEKLKNIVRSDSSKKNDIRSAIYNLTHNLSESILEEHTSLVNFKTPMGIEIKDKLYEFKNNLVVTTRADKDTIGVALSQAFGCCPLGYMDFEGRRALEALNQPIRHVELPNIANKLLDDVIIGKTVLATGCTAISLTKQVLKKYRPKRLIIASLFYSESGVKDLMHEFPNATIVIAGSADKILPNGMLIPGLGNIDERLA